MNKNCLCNLAGCAVFLFVGVRTQNAKAIYPDASVVEAYWKKNPKIFQETFEKLFPQAEQLHLLGEEFDQFKEKNGILFEIDGYASWKDCLPFHTVSDLQQLPCDAELKKICRVLGSREFLTKVLPEEVIQSIFNRAFGGEKLLKTMVLFGTGFMHFGEKFFDMFGRGKLKMDIYQFVPDSPGSRCFEFRLRLGLEKQDNLTVTRGYSAYYHNGGRFGSTKIEFLKKAKQLPYSPWNDLKSAIKKIPSVYKQLRDDVKKGKKHAVGDFRTALGFAVDDFQYKTQLSDNYKGTSKLLNILATEDFPKRIFGEKLWNMLEHGDRSDFTSRTDSRVDLSPRAGGFKVFILFRNFYKGNKAKDCLRYSGERCECWWYDLNYIYFVFFYNPKQDEISDVRLYEKLVLNYELIQRAATSNKLEKDDGFLLFEDKDFKEQEVKEEE